MATIFENGTASKARLTTPSWIASSWFGRLVRRSTTQVGNWTRVEMKHAIDHWRSQFRGEARVKNDNDISQADIDTHNLIVWGDPKSNTLSGKGPGEASAKMEREKHPGWRPEL